MAHSNQCDSRQRSLRMKKEQGIFEAEMNRGFLQILVLAVLEKEMYGYMMLKHFINFNGVYM